MGSHILRVLNTNVDGRYKSVYGMTRVRGIGRRFASLMCKIGQGQISKRIGEISVEQLEKLIEIVSHPSHYMIPIWFLNSQKEYQSGTNGQVTVTQIDGLLRDTLDRSKRI